MNITEALKGNAAAFNTQGSFIINWIHSSENSYFYSIDKKIIETFQNIFSLVIFQLHEWIMFKAI